jgi:hypothetical protein
MMLWQLSCNCQYYFLYIEIKSLAAELLKIVKLIIITFTFCDTGMRINGR